MDGRPDAVVRGPARYGRLRWRLPGASRGDHAVAGRLAGGDRGSAARLRAFAGHRPAGCRRGALPAGRGPSSERRVRGGRGGVSRRERAGPGAPTGLGAVAPRAGTLRRGRHRHSSRRKHDGGPAETHEPAARLYRDHVGRRRRRGRAQRLPGAGGDCPELRYGGAGCDCRAGARSGGAGRRRRAGRARLAPPRLRGVAADRGALRRCARARADRTGLPRPRGRGRRRSGDRRGQVRIRAAGRRAGPRADRLADRTAAPVRSCSSA